MEKVLISLERDTMKVNKKEIHFSQKNVELLGVRVNERGRMPAEVERSEMLELLRPRMTRNLEDSLA
jgi:hypothetical protein